MNWRAGFLRVWVVMAVLWVGIAIWQFASGCWWFWADFPVCRNGNGNALAGLESFTGYDWIAWLVFMFGLPATLLCVGLISAWIIGGFLENRN
jgi:hypothetical protein